MPGSTPPLFSVLIPTRNRASLLREALRTALAQDFDDYEIVVSDNNSTDDTQLLLAEHCSGHCAPPAPFQSTEPDENRSPTDLTAGPCLRIMHHDRDLSMCEHWELILRRARGRYVMFLADDDGLTPGVLSYLARLLQRWPVDCLYWRGARYVHPDVPDGQERCRLAYSLESRRLYVIPSSLLIRAFYDFDRRTYILLPKLLNALVSRRLLERCRRAGEVFCLPPFPDYSAACHILASATCCYWFDCPLFISGVSYHSNAGRQYLRRQKYDRYLALFGEDLLAGVPYAMRYLDGSYFLSTQFRFHRIYPSAFPGEYNWDAYLRFLFEEIVAFQGAQDVSAELALLAAYMLQHYQAPVVFQRLMHAHQSGSRARRILQAMAIARRYPALRDLLHLLRYPRRAAWQLVRSERRELHTTFRVSSMVRASQLLGRVLAEALPAPETLTPIPVTSLDDIGKVTIR